jgi:hypothetical protein
MFGINDPVLQACLVITLVLCILQFLAGIAQIVILIRPNHKDRAHRCGTCGGRLTNEIDGKIAPILKGETDAKEN